MKPRNFLIGLDAVTQGNITRFPKRAHSEGLKESVLKLEEDCKCWVRGAGIQGFGVAKRTTNSIREDSLALKVYVKEKKARNKLLNPIPKRITLPEIGAIPIDVEEVGSIRVHGTSRYRPGIPGASCAHVDVKAGTLGCTVVREPYDGKLYFLGNSHMLANDGRANIGDKILQPSTRDGGNANDDWIATLADFIPYEFGSDYDNDNIDAAIAMPRRRTMISRELRIFGFIPNGSSYSLREGQTVFKVGRTSDDTTGTIVDPHYRRVFWKKGRKVAFRELVLCQSFSRSGDSGAPVFNQNNNVVGMVLAGNERRSLFIKIAHIERLLGIRVPQASEVFP